MAEVKESNCWTVNYFRKSFVSGEVSGDWKTRNPVWRLERGRETANYRAVSLPSILGSEFEMILMDELNDTFGEGQFNRGDSAWIYQRQACQRKIRSFLGWSNNWFTYGRTNEKLLRFSEIFGPFHKMNYCTKCHDTCQSIQLTKGEERNGVKNREPRNLEKDHLLQGLAIRTLTFLIHDGDNRLYQDIWIHCSASENGEGPECWSCLILPA